MEKIIKRTESLGNLTATLVAVQFDGEPVLDTKVDIDGQNLCYITWSEKENFFKELNDVINKYRI